LKEFIVAIYCVDHLELNPTFYGFDFDCIF